MACTATALVPAEPAAIRALLTKVRPAAHGMAPKTWANLLSRFRKELRIAGVIDPGYPGFAARQPLWGPLMRAISTDKGLSNGLAAFCNWCAAQSLAPDAVDDHAVQRFHKWLEARTLCPRPRDVVRQAPRLWNKAGKRIGAWPRTRLTLISFRAPAKRWTPPETGLFVGFVIPFRH